MYINIRKGRYARDCLNSFAVSYVGKRLKEAKRYVENFLIKLHIHVNGLLLSSKCDLKVFVSVMYENKTIKR